MSDGLKKVLFVVSTLEGEHEGRSVGPGRVMSGIATRLPRLGYEPLFCSAFGPTDSPLIRRLEDDGLAVKHLRMGSMFDPRGAMRFSKLVARFEPQVVHSRTIRADLLARLASRSGSAVINNIVNLYPDDSLTWHGPIKGRAVLALARLTARPVDLFVANARALTDSIERVFGAPSSKIRVVHDGVDLERWSGHHPADLSHVGIEKKDRVFFTAARLHPQKGIEDLIRAAAGILSSTSDLHFVVAGEGPSRQALTQLIEAKGIRGRFHLLGWRDDIEALLARADLFVLPSRFEGLPNSVIEAMASGRATVATAVAGTPELIQEGSTGWLCPPDDPAALEAALQLALDSDLQAAGKRARARAEQHFSMDACATAFAALYEEVAG